MVVYIFAQKRTAIQEVGWLLGTHTLPAREFCAIPQKNWKAQDNKVQSPNSPKDSGPKETESASNSEYLGFVSAVVRSSDALAYDSCTPLP